MGSVIDYIECPNCSQEAYNDFFYKTGEEFTNCEHCGYHYSCVIVDRNKPLNELTEDDFEIKELKSPYGAYRIKHYDWTGNECGTIETESAFNFMKSEAEKVDNLEYFSVSRYIDGEVKKEMIIDNGPKYDSAGFSQEDRQLKN